MANQEIDLEDWLIEHSEQHALLQSGQDLILQNPFGNIRVRTSNDDTVSVFAIVQRHVTDPVEPIVSIGSTTENMTVTVTYPEGNKPAINELFIQKRRVDVSVLAPSSASMSVTTKHGRAESKGHKGSLKLRSTTGPIIAVSKGAVDAESERGSVNVLFKGIDWAQPSSIETKTGDIRVEFIEHPDVLVNIDTNGYITTDYSISIDSGPGSSQKQAVAKIGQATQSMNIKSDRGAVTLSRIFEMIHVEKKIAQNVEEAAQSGQ